MKDQKSHGNRVVRFMQTFLTLGGSFAGQPFVPMPWMEDVLEDIYRLRPDGKRKHRTYLLGVPRKNAKSTICAGVGIYQLVADPADPMPQVIVAAGDKKQARLVFDEARRMVRANADLDRELVVQRDVILNPRNGGEFRVVSADAGLAHGTNPSTVIVDEYHVHKTADLYVALNTGSGTRNQPLTIVITTAGFDLESPLGMLYQYARRVEAGEVDDDSFGFTWYGPTEGEKFDPYDEAVWERFNPSWEIINVDEIRSRSKQLPESEFVRYHLNGWTAAKEAWLPSGAWESVEDTSKPLADGDEIILGFDGAYKGDSTALVACRLSDMYLQVVAAWEAPLDDPHWRTPVRDVEDAIRAACERYMVREVSCDPFTWEQSMDTLEGEGLPMVEYRTNNLKLFSPACSGFYKAVMDGELSHDGSPVLARHVRNATLKEDNRGPRIVKVNRSSKKHIDLAVAAVVAWHRASLWLEPEEEQEAQLIIL